MRAVVLEKLQHYVGSYDDLPLSTRLLDDLGIDSIAFVTILMDLADELELDLAVVKIELKHIRTLEDVIALVDTMRQPALRAG